MKFKGDIPYHLLKKVCRVFFFFYRDGRYLLIMTENFAALPRIKQLLLEQYEEEPYVIFGSGFPKDQLFTQVKILRYMSHVSFTLSACVSVYYLCHCLYHLITACISLYLMSLSLSACLSAYLFKCVSFCLFNVSVALAISFSVAFTH